MSSFLLLLLVGCITIKVGGNDSSDASDDATDSDSGVVIEEVFVDNDSDGFDAAEDCDDTDPNIHPGATEYCNGLDDNCDGEVDEAGAIGASTWYIDTDGDGYGNGAYTTTACNQPKGYVNNGTDRDDDNPKVQ